MKSVINNKISGLFAAAAMLFATSCVKDNLTDASMSGDEVLVTFTISPEDLKAAGTRAVQYPNGEDQDEITGETKVYKHISDGTKADMLIYAVYDGTTNELIEKYGTETSEVSGFTPGIGQTILAVDKVPKEFQLLLNRNHEYKIAFWAQSSKCKAYNTDDLRKVEVIYSNITEDAVGDSSAGSDSKMSTPNNDENFYKTVEGEEFLRVDLNGDGKISGYVGLDTYVESEGAAKSEDASNYTETFKYLSMCYVLVNSKTIDEEADPSNKEKYGSTLLNNVVVWMAEDENGTNAQKIVDLTSVPVQRNYRTNTISQNMLTSEHEITVHVSPIYAGDFNGEYDYDDNTADWSGPIYDGVSYNAETDEILISNANGLLWLAKMVNGKYTYYIWDADSSLPDSNESDNDMDDEDMNNTGFYNKLFTDSGFDDPTIEEDTPKNQTLKKRILTATHQGETWPENNNFHFTGAKVRLTNDIDMKGIKWIPIGFDCRINDPIKQQFDEKNADHVGFCGTFNGSNLSIRNLTNREFASVIHWHYKTLTGNNLTDKERYDTPQWYPVGLFGQVGGDATIQNVRLSNVNFKGHHIGGAVVGVASGSKVTIKECYVDGGTLSLTPMFRGDWESRKSADKIGIVQGRTFARAIYLGGIIGLINTTTGSSVVEKCNVRNLTLEAYRNIGGIVGTDDPTSNTKSSITGNTVTNTLIIANKFQPYDYCYNRLEDKAPSDGQSQVPSQALKTGFGWRYGQPELSSQFVGGQDQETYLSNNANNVTVAKFANRLLDKSGKETSTEVEAYLRRATIGDTPLEYLPLLSSWYTDEIMLTSNFTGSNSAYKGITNHKFVRTLIQTGEKETYTMPFILPFYSYTDFIETSGKAGMYIESIVLDCAEEGKRVVVTAEGLTGANDCVAYVTSRDMTEFVKKENKTEVRNMTLRGEPYAYTGVCLAPNEFAKEIKFLNVAIYDVYKTIELQNGSNAANTALTITSDEDKTSNLRGYTECGSGWAAVNFYRTVFERGANTGKGKSEYTCKVESNTTFKNCWFKAPYIIEIANGATVVFDNALATAAQRGDEFNEELTLEGHEGCTKIIIEDDGKGNVSVKYE